MVRDAVVLVVALASCTSPNPAYDGVESSMGGGVDGEASTGMIAPGSSTGPATSVGSMGATSSSSSSSAEGEPATTDAESTTGAQESTTTGDPLGCQSALWVTGDVAVEANGDAPFFTRLQELGFSATVVQNAASQPEDVGDHCLVVLSPLGAASDVEDKFRDAPVPVITWEYNLYDNMRMVDPFGPNWGIADPLDVVQLVDPAHPLAAGLAGVVPLYMGGGRISWGIPAGEVQIVATLPGDPTRATHFAFEAGAVMADGFVAPARRVALGGGETVIAPTPQAVELFAAAVEWAVGP